MTLHPSLTRFLFQPWFSYLILILLQFKIMWRIWDYKDLPDGDTAAYFTEAYYWHLDHFNNIFWSPLYTAFLGCLLHVTSDVYAVMILHRLIIAFTVSILVLALMRKLLPHSLAWCIAAWWVILPINFDTMYEVHLFSVIPLLVASLLVLHSPGRWGRGGAIAILAGSTVLVRNELSLATLMLALLCLAWEIWKYRISSIQMPLRRYILPYGIPMLLAGLISAFFYERSYLKVSDPGFAIMARGKHTYNVCQIYAVGYQQRHPEWTKNPWTECQGLMQQTFGQPLPTLSEAFLAKPQAILEHFSWNIKLALNGLQVALFNATSGSVNPDYATVNLNQAWVLLPTLLVTMILVNALFVVYRERNKWWNSWLKQRIWGWAVMLSVASVSAFVVLPMQRPRPSYLFSLTIFLMAAVGMGIFIIFSRWPVFYKTRIFVPVLAIALLIVVPPYYHSSSSDRFLLSLYHQLQPFQTLMSQPKTLFLNRQGSDELCFYFEQVDMSLHALHGNYKQQVRRCKPLTYGSPDFFAGVPAQTTLPERLQEQKVNLFYADAALLDWLNSNPKTQRFLINPEADGWKLVGQQNGAGERWMLFQKLDPSQTHTS